jgi:hypothetical protein
VEPQPQPQTQNSGVSQQRGEVSKQQQGHVNPQVQSMHQVHDPPPASGPLIDPRYRALTCYNWEPGHFVGIYIKLKVCFICAIPGHYMSECPSWKKVPLVASYMGNA